MVVCIFVNGSKHYLIDLKTINYDPEPSRLLPLWRNTKRSLYSVRYILRVILLYTRLFYHVCYSYLFSANICCLPKHKHEHHYYGYHCQSIDDKPFFVDEGFARMQPFLVCLCWLAPFPSGPITKIDKSSVSRSVF